MGVGSVPRCWGGGKEVGGACGGNEGCEAVVC